MVRSALLKKFIRDILRAKGQFISIIILSALGVLVFSGLDGAWRNIDLSLSRYFEGYRLPDFWVVTQTAGSAEIKKIAGLKGVSAAQGRYSGEVETTLPGEPKLMLNAVDGTAIVNIPRIVSGKPLLKEDLQGCLLDEQFALAHGLLPGDGITFRLAGREATFIVRGLISSPEYVFSAKDIIPEPQLYGFVYTNLGSFQGLAMNEICVLLDKRSDAGAVKIEIERALPRTFVMDRKSHRSTQTVRNEMLQYKSLSKVFPVLFFAVSALIVLTTMTRMMENQRLQMGIMKSLGYKKGRIMRHYMAYAFFPSVIGSAAGLLIGRSTLPSFLFDVMLELYVLPDMVTAPLSADSSAICILSVLLSCLICYVVCMRNTAETSASLLRPRPPKSGSRIFLEHVSILWSSLSFNAKMIQRNLFRSKSRTLMAFIGVLGCTALIVTAFGIMDSIGYLIDTYYGNTLRYELSAELNGTAGSPNAYDSRVPARTTECIMEKAVSIKGDKNGHAAINSRTTVLTVVEDGQRLISLDREIKRDTGNTKGKGGASPGDAAGKDNIVRNGAVPVLDVRTGVMMTEKLAEVMGLEAGDGLSLKFPGESKPIAAVIERLVPVQIGQGLFMYESVWDTLGKGAFKPTEILMDRPEAGCVNYLEDLDEANSIKWMAASKEKTVTGLQGINSIAFLMASFALLLAFVVLYNMGVLNFIERSREFATLKVLGYHRKEMRSLIMKENILISVIGILAGVLPGIWLTGTVMKACEPEDMVFTAYVSPWSIGAACGITLLFSILIQVFLVRRVSAIDMVQALKSVE